MIIGANIITKFQFVASIAYLRKVYKDLLHLYLYATDEIYSQTSN